MIRINDAVLHVFDFESGSIYLSERELDLGQRQTRSYVQREMRKVSGSAESEHGRFEEGSAFADELKGYLAGQQTFLEISRNLASWFWEKLRTSDDTEQADLLVCDFREEVRLDKAAKEAAEADDAEESEAVLDAAFEAKGARYFAALLLPRKKSFAHELQSFEGAAANELVRTDGVLPNPSQKVESYLCVNEDTLDIDFADKARAIGSTPVRLIPDELLRCTTTPSAHEAIDKVNVIVQDLAEEYGLTPAVEVSRVKAEMARDADRYEEIKPQEIAERVWGDDQPEVRERFEQRVREEQLPEEVPVRRGVANRMAKTHRIRTDTGIDIAFPSEYSSDDTYIEFDQQPDGTISITIKNVVKIENR